MPPDREKPGGGAPETPSFDPHTWLGGRASPDGRATPPATPPPPSTPPPLPPGSPQTSFDPATWLKPLDVKPPPPPPPPPPSRRGLMIAGGGIVALGAAGAVGVLTLGRRRGAAPPQASPAGAPHTAAAGGALLFDADSLLHLQILLSQYRISDTEALAVRDALASGFRGKDGKLHIAARLSSVHGADDQILSLTARALDGSGVRLDRVSGRLVSTPLAPGLQARLCATATGEMNATSFASSFDRVMHDEGLVAQFAAAMAYDINFTHDLSPGCQFRGVYQQSVDADGNQVGDRRLVFAFLDVKAIHDTDEFEGGQTARDVAARTIKLYLFDTGDGQASWFDENGASIVRGLMRTPVDGARVTSKFGLRMHPIYEVVKFHEGVDFGCPVGTPVYAAGDGEVVIASVVQGYGNYLRIKHTDHLWTAYGHLSGYAPTTVVGAKVKQGQVVAFTGNTGNSTGPHLHFEIRVDGVAVDPLTFHTDRTSALQGAQLAAFRQARDRIDAVQTDCS